MSTKDFQYVRKSRDKVIQQNLFSDFKKLIFFNFFLVLLFFIFAFVIYIASLERQNIFMIGLVVFVVVSITSNVILIRKLKRVEEEYREFSEAVIRKAELGQ